VEEIKSGYTNVVVQLVQMSNSSFFKTNIMSQEFLQFVESAKSLDAAKAVTETISTTLDEHDIVLTRRAVKDDDWDMFNMLFEVPFDANAPTRNMGEEIAKAVIATAEKREASEVFNASVHVIQASSAEVLHYHVTFYVDKEPSS
jgi:hypothetical protein